MGRPFYAHVYVTRRCNLNCAICGIRPLGDDAPELDPTGFAEAARVLRRLGVAAIVLSGGEPFARDDLPAIVRAFARQGFSIRVQTNGGRLTTPEKMAAAAEAGAEEFSVSFSSRRPELAARLHQSADVFPHNLEVLREAARLRPRGMNCAGITVLPQNLDELPDLVRTVHELGAWAVPNPAMTATAPDPAQPFRGWAPEFDPRRADADLARRVYAELLRMRRSGVRLAVSESYLHASLRYILTGEEKWNCRAGEHYLVIDADGGVRPCRDLPVFANVRDPDFLTRWQAGPHRRDWLAARQACPGCLHACWRDVGDYLERPHRAALAAGRYLLERSKR